MTEAEYGDAARASEREIDRKDTGIRILLTILFALIVGVIDAALGLIILFALLWALITKQPPGVGVGAGAHLLRLPRGARGVALDSGPARVRVAGLGSARGRPRATGTRSDRRLTGP